ncbi:unnamed protein product, partial [Adineta steineri]
MEQEPNEIDKSDLDESTALENEESRKTKIKKRNRNSRPSQKNKKNRNSKPSQKNKKNRNSKPSKKNKKNRYTKPSAQIRNTAQLERVEETNIVFPSESNWSIFHPPIEENFESTQIHDVLKERNKLQISIIPEDLILGFMEQRAITLTHVYMSIIIIRGHQAALKGQVVHFHVDTDVTVEDLLPFPRCYEFLAVVQEKPIKNNQVTTTVTYSFSPVHVLKALFYLKQHNHLYKNKNIMKLHEIQEMFKCQPENIIPIRIIDSYAYNNSTTNSPIIEPSEILSGPKRVISCAENPTWQIEPYLEEKCYPWLYPLGKGGEADPERPIAISLRDYYKLRLKSSDNRWQKDPTWVFRALNMLQREDLRKSVNYHAKRKYRDGKMCYLIYPDIGVVIRGSAAYWAKARRHLRSMYATLGKPFIFLSINLQDDVEFLTNIDPNRFGSVHNPNWEAIDNLSDDEYLTLINENPGLVARMCKRRMVAFEDYIKDKKHPFLIDFVVTQYFL